MAHVRHSRPLFTPARHWHRGRTCLCRESCCDRRAALGKMSDQGIDWPELNGRRSQKCRKRYEPDKLREKGGCSVSGRSARAGPGSAGRTRRAGRVARMRASNTALGRCRVSPHAHCAACMVERWSGRDTKFKGPGIRTGDRMWVGRLERSASRRWFVGEPADARRGANFRAKVRTGARAPFESGVLASFSRRLGRGGRPYGVYAPGSAQVTRMHEFDNAK